MKIGELTAVFDWDGFSRSRAALNRHLRMSERTVSRSLQTTFNTMNRMSALSSSNMARDMGRAFRNVQQIAQSAFNRVTSAYNSLRSHIGRGIVSTIKFNGINEAKGQVNGLQRQLAGLAAGALGAAGAGQTGKFVFSAASEYETAITRLTTLVGKQKAPQIFKDLQKFAATTPNELPEVIEMFNRLEGAGFGLLDKKGNLDYKALTELGDLAAASGKDLAYLTETMLSTGRGQGAMVDSFVGLAAVAEKGGLAVEMFDRSTGKTIKQMVDPKNKKAIREFFQAGGRRQGIAGGMADLSKTLAGQQAQIQDAFKSAAVAFYQGFGPHVHKLLLNIINSMGDFEQKIKGIGRDVGVFIAKDLPRTLRQINDLLPLVAAGISLMAANIVGSKIIMLVANFDKAMFLASLSATALNIAVGGAFLLAIGLAMDFIYYIETGDSKILAFTKRWPWLHDAIKTAYDYWIQAGKDALKWLEKTAWQFENVKSQIKFTGEFVQIWLIDTFKSFENQITNAFNLIKEMFGWVLDKAGPVIGVFEKLIPGSMRNAADFGNAEQMSLISPTGTGQQRIATAALQFVQSGNADKLMRANPKNLFKIGKACAYTTREFLKMGGVSDQVLGRMSDYVPQVYDSLLKGGFAELVDFSQVKPGDIAIAGDKSHIGVIGPEGRNQLIHASNTAGKQVGMGQRIVAKNNYFGAGGKYLRIKDQYINYDRPQQTVTPANVGSPRMMQAQPQGQTVNMTASPIQNFNFIGSNGAAIAAQVGAAAQQGTAQALRSTAAQTTNRRD